MKSWYEDNEFWETMAHIIFSERHWAAAPVEIDQVISLLGCQAEATILDLCCGPGRHSLELARRGYHVTGVDRTAAYIEKARREAKREGLAIEFVQDDMRHFCRPSTFDVAMMMSTSFGYFEDPAENRQVLTNVYRSLKGQGTFILDVIGKEVLARVFRERDWSEHNGVILLQERKVVSNWTRMESRWIVLQGQEQHEFRVSHWLYSATELSVLLWEGGFGLIDVYGDFDGIPYDHTARKLVAMARK